MGCYINTIKDWLVNIGDKSNIDICERILEGIFVVRFGD